MILTVKQIEQRINSPKNITIKETVRISNGTHEVKVRDGANHTNHGSKHLTDEERLSIGVLAKVTDNQTAAELMGVSERTAKDLKNGLRNEYMGKDSPNRNYTDINLKNQIEERVNSAKLTATERATEILLSSLGLLTPDKLENSSAKEIASITSQMSQVVRNLDPVRNSGDSNKTGTKVQIVLHQPKQAREEAFDYIEIGVK